jgi:cation:H+ antiporter
MTLLMLALGFALLTFGASLLVDGAASIAKRFGISSLVIGLTVVAFGTSTPELVVNVVSALKGTTDIAIGNILGSNVFNIFAILGLSALIRRLPVQASTVYKEIPLSLIAALILFPLGASFLSLPLDGADPASLGRIDGIILLLFFVYFLRYTFKTARSGTDNEGDPVKIYGVPFSIGMIIAGLTMLVFGGKFLVDAAVEIARSFGMTERVIGLTIVAAGTSLPELATSMVAAYKKNADIAIGNIVGSNIFNIFFILSVSSVILPLPFSDGTIIDLSVTALASMILFLAVYRHHDRHLDRRDGVLFLLCYVLYVAYLMAG